jgi:hypothetical protein
MAAKKSLEDEQIKLVTIFDFQSFLIQIVRNVFGSVQKSQNSISERFYCDIIKLYTKF